MIINANMLDLFEIMTEIAAIQRSAVMSGIKNVETITMEEFTDGALAYDPQKKTVIGSKTYCLLVRDVAFDEKTNRPLDWKYWGGDNWMAYIEFDGIEPIDDDIVIIDVFDTVTGNTTATIAVDAAGFYLRDRVGWEEKK